MNYQKPGTGLMGGGPFVLGRSFHLHRAIEAAKNHSRYQSTEDLEWKPGVETLETENVVGK